MPTVTLKVSDDQHELWVVAANKEGCSLSEWLRRAAMSRAGAIRADSGVRIDTPVQPTLDAVSDVVAGTEAVGKISFPSRTAFKPDFKTPKKKKP